MKPYTLPTSSLTPPLPLRLPNLYPPHPPLSTSDKPLPTCNQRSSISSPLPHNKPPYSFSSAPHTPLGGWGGGALLSPPLFPPPLYPPTAPHPLNIGLLFYSLLHSPPSIYAFSLSYHQPPYTIPDRHISPAHVSPLPSSLPSPPRCLIPLSALTQNNLPPPPHSISLYLSTPFPTILTPCFPFPPHLSLPHSPGPSTPPPPTRTPPQPFLSPPPLNFLSLSNLSQSAIPGLFTPPLPPVPLSSRFLLISLLRPCSHSLPPVIP
uniref:Uncharacterized protein n=1 Tax=Knipowitschia caucasica TaxID=637954 RepID=A0AAV2KPD1_KNICA